MAPLPPEELYTLAPDVPDLRGPDGRGMVLVEMLDGFVDAGAARRLARDHLLAGGASVLIASFDVDLLFDYRARRPPMVFVEDHWASYDTPRLDLRLLTDADGTGFVCCPGRSRTSCGNGSRRPWNNSSAVSGCGCASAPTRSRWRCRTRDRSA